MITIPAPAKTRIANNTYKLSPVSGLSFVVSSSGGKLARGGLESSIMYSSSVVSSSVNVPEPPGMLLSGSSSPSSVVVGPGTFGVVGGGCVGPCVSGSLGVVGSIIVG